MADPESITLNSSDPRFLPVILDTVGTDAFVLSVGDLALPPMSAQQVTSLFLALKHLETQHDQSASTP